MKHIRIIALLLVTTLLFVGLISCESSEEAKKENALVGTWEVIEWHGNKFSGLEILSFYSNGTAIKNNESSWEWSINEHNEEELHLMDSWEVKVYKFSIEGNKLTLRHTEKTNQYAILKKK